MTENNKEIIIAVFEGEDRADQVLTDMEALGAGEVSSLRSEGTVITMDEKGKVSVAGPKAKLRGSVIGGVVGVFVGSLVGVPVAGAILGGAAGAYGSRKRVRQKLEEVTSDTVELQQLVDLMTPDSSVIIAEIADDWVGDMVDAFESRGASMVLHATEEEMAAALVTELEAHEGSDE